eukprot:2673482-Alexandrium_andersonii.AAC.1
MWAIHCPICSGNHRVQECQRFREERLRTPICEWCGGPAHTNGPNADWVNCPHGPLMSQHDLEVEATFHYGVLKGSGRSGKDGAALRNS